MEIGDDKRKQVGNDLMSLDLAAPVGGLLSALVHLDGFDSASSLTYSGACHKPYRLSMYCETARLPCSMEYPSTFLPSPPAQHAQTPAAALIPHIHDYTREYYEQNCGNGKFTTE